MSRLHMSRLLSLFACFAACSIVAAGDGNRLAYLDECNPWYPDKDFPKLITPQWVGEDGVEAVVVLAIDDMRDTAKYEQYLRPILNRLKQIDGRAPVSIMTCEVKPDDPQLQSWLEEGLSIEVHTIDHPCPLLQGSLEKAQSTYDRCIDLLSQIPGNKPVAFRTPCCDSLNTVSPRFYSEIFSGTTPEGNYLQIDSSVMNFFTSDDESIPRDLVLDEDGNERFWKYKVKNLKRGEIVHNNFVNYITNYPYPYVINNTCWQFPCVAPSDWSAQHLHGVNNPQTVEDWKAALDITVHKQGVFNLVFHPHGWITAEQVVELIDHAVKKHGKKVKFLTFREAAERLSDNLTDWDRLSSERRILDVDGDGFIDIVYGGIRSMYETEERGKDDPRATRIWTDGAWQSTPFPVCFLESHNHGLSDRHVRFFSHPANGITIVFDPNPLRADWQAQRQPTGWEFTGTWKPNPVGPSGGIRDLKIPRYLGGTRFLDFDGDGFCELLLFHNHFEENLMADIPGKSVSEVWKYEVADQTWLPTNAQFPIDPNRHLLQAIRFVDVNQDGLMDLCLSDEMESHVWLMTSKDLGWTKKVLLPDASRWPSFFRDGTVMDLAGNEWPYQEDNGFFVHDRHLCWQNEDTAHLPDLIYRVSFDELLAAADAGGTEQAGRNKVAPNAGASRTGEQRQQSDNGSIPIDGDRRSGDEPVRSIRPTPVGAAVIDITPDYPVRLTGYGNRTKESEGIATPIHARALVIGGNAPRSEAPPRNALPGGSASGSAASDAEREQQAEPARQRVPGQSPGTRGEPLTVLLTVDNCGVPDEVTEVVFAKLAEQYGIARERFAVSSTHTHSGPWLRDFAPLIFADIPADHAPHLEQYERDLIDKLVDVVGKAIDARRPATLSVGKGKAGFAKNRRALTNGQWVGFGETDQGPVDRRLPVLAAHDADGKLIAVLANYACHATTETGDFNQISGDWPGFAADMIEADHPGAVALIAIGTGADANPSPRGTHEQAKQHGREVADEVNRSLLATARRAVREGELHPPSQTPSQQSRRDDMTIIFSPGRQPGRRET
ncbi:MAG: neutral/alkaline non-lysosomal ceramidase N-terminal domain-containing protein [Planctomycetaceae bacterium]